MNTGKINMDLSKLKDPFPVKDIEWRPGKIYANGTLTKALAYIDARALYDRLDEVCGPENWQLKYSHTGQKTVCDIAIKIDDEWVWKANGAGDTNFEAEKGALSDAAKRAGVVWGIGRYLYDLPSREVRVTEYKKIELSDLDQLQKEYLNLFFTFTEKETENLKSDIDACETLQDLDTIRNIAESNRFRMTQGQKILIGKTIKQKKLEINTYELNNQAMERIAAK